MEKADTSVEAIVSRAKDQFGVEMDIYQVSENTMRALDLLGMLKLKKNVLVGKVNSSQQLRLPVDACDVKAVVTPRALNNCLPHEMRIFVNDIYFPPAIFFVPIPNATEELADLLVATDVVVKYIDNLKGPYIDFNWNPPFIEVNSTEASLVVIYTSIPIDENGLALIPSQAFEACLYYNLYIHFQPMFLQQKVPIAVWQEIKAWKDSKFRQGKNKYMMSRLSSNELNKVMDIVTSFDRKRVNRDA